MNQVDTSTIDWPAWAARWEAQQQLHIPRREQRFEVMGALIEELVRPEPRAILDLACGPGSISRRMLARFPNSSVVALDADPFLLEIGRKTLGDAGGRLHWVQGDLRSQDWSSKVRAWAPFEAVLTSTALHWLAAPDLVATYRILGELMRPGGVFFNADHLMVASPASPFGAALRSVRTRLAQPERGDGETWDEWWAAAQAEPRFAALLTARGGVFNEVHPRHHEYITARFHQEALTIAGFQETAVVWRFLDDTIVGAIR